MDNKDFKILTKLWKINSSYVVTIPVMVVKEKELQENTLVYVHINSAKKN